MGRRTWRPPTRRAAVFRCSSTGATAVSRPGATSQLARFANKKVGVLKSESLAAYRARVRRIVDAYRAYLDDGRTPQIKAAGARRARTSDGAAAWPATPSQETSRAAAPSPVTDMVEYPFPLQSGTLASVRLPKRFEKVDAE